MKNTAITSAICAMSAFLIFGCAKEEQVRIMPPTPALLVESAKKDVEQYVSTLGTTASAQSVSVIPQVSGQITKINFKQGEFVKKGQVLAVIDPRPYEAAVKQAEGNLAQAKAQLKIDELEVERNKKLAKDNFIAKQTFDSLVARVEVDKGVIDAAQAALDTAKINLDWCYVKAPVSGKVGFYNITSGNIVTANTPTSTITTIEDVDNLYVDFVVPSQRLSEIMALMKEKGGKIEMEVSYIESDLKHKTRTTFAEIVMNKIRYETGTAVLRGVLENKDHLFWPDQPVKVILKLHSLKDAVLVPEICVQAGLLGSFLYVAHPNKDGVFVMEQVQVETGQLYEGNMRLVKTDKMKGGELVSERVMELLLQAGPFVYRATEDGGVYGADGKVLTSKEEVAKFMQTATQTTQALRVEMMKKRQEAASASASSASKK